MIALLGCTHGVKRNPEESLIHYQLAADSLKNRRVEAALAELQRAIDLDPENPEAWNLMGIIALQQGAEYMAQLEVQACLKGADAETVRRDATARFKEAEQRFRKAVELRPGYSEGWNNLAVAALHLQEYGEAARAGTEALKDVTYNAPELARANLGWAYFHQKQIQNAWKELNDAVSRSPGFCVGRYRLGRVYLERGEYAAAAEQLEAVVGNPQCPIQEAVLFAGLVQSRRKQPERARELFQRCVQMAPRSCIAGECRRYAELTQ